MRTWFGALVVLAVLAAAFGQGCGNAGGGLDFKLTKSSPASQLDPGDSTEPEVDENGDPIDTSTKSLFSEWTVSDGTFRADLTQCAFDQKKTVTLKPAFIYPNCTCQVVITGTNAAGSATFTECSDANCNKLAGDATYRNTSTGLRVCNSTTCYDFR